MTLVIEEVASGVFVVQASHTNFVLVVDGDEVTFIDSGYPKDRALVVAALEHTGRSFGDVTAMLLTHAHVDHIGSAEWLRREHDVPVWCHELEVRQATGEIVQRISERELLVRLWRPSVARFVVNVVRSGGLRPEHVTEVVTFAADGAVDVPGRPVPVHTPGHTEGHVGLHLSDRGVLVTGDALITVDLWDDARRGPQLIAPPFNHDHQLALRTLGRFAELEADVLVPGHGEVHRGSPQDAVRAALAAA